MNNKKLHLTILTYAAPTSNYRGESQNNRTVLQKIFIGNKEYVIVSSAAIRNAQREMLAKVFTCNRSRVIDAEQISVQFKEIPNPDKYADDSLFGYLMTQPKGAVRGIHPARRDSLVQVNMAVALDPYLDEALFQQSPMIEGPWKNSDSSALINREVVYTAFQYPISLVVAQFADHFDWLKEYMSVVAELSNVAGAHASSLYSFAPRSVFCRVTNCRAPQYNPYGFLSNGDHVELSRIGDGLPGNEFWIGGEVVRNLSKEDFDRLTASGAHLYKEAHQAINEATAAAIKDD